MEDQDRGKSLPTLKNDGGHSKGFAHRCHVYVVTRCMRNLFPPISDMRCVIRFHLFQSLVAMGIVPNPQDQFGKGKSNDKGLDTAKEKLEEFMKGPLACFPEAREEPRLTTCICRGRFVYRDNELFKSEMLHFESKSVDFHWFYFF